MNSYFERLVMLFGVLNQLPEDDPLVQFHQGKWGLFKAVCHQLTKPEVNWICLVERHDGCMTSNETRRQRLNDHFSLAIEALRAAGFNIRTTHSPTGLIIVSIEKLTKKTQPREIHMVNGCLRLTYPSLRRNTNKSNQLPEN